MKRILVLALCLLLLPSHALADVLWEPYEDSFYNAHKDECTPLTPYRAYMPKDEEGVPHYPAPDQPQFGLATDTGKIYIQWLYTAPDGSEWGYAEQLNGWVNLYDLLLVYDSIAFMADHSDQIDSSATYSVQEYCPDGCILWGYPGDMEPGHRLEAEFLDEGFTVSETYTDPQGRLWGYVPYWRGIRQKWICLDEPLNEEAFISTITADEPVAEEPAPEAEASAAPEPTPLLVDTEAPEYTPVQGLPLPWLGLLLGGGAAAIAAVMIKLLKKKK